jgi:uncharacterized integral membrane protein
MARSEPELIAEAKGKKERGWRFYLTSVLGVLALVFVLQNTDSTNINFLFAEGEMPLFFALLITLLVGILIGWLTPRVRRSGKRE